MTRNYENIKQLRTQLGWSQQQLADELETSRVTIARWEIGNRTPSRAMQEKIEKRKEN